MGVLKKCGVFILIVVLAIVVAGLYGIAHNSSYLGGVLAILVAWAFHIIIRVRTKDETNPQGGASGSQPMRSETNQTSTAAGSGR
jgi:hypothetical protein